MREFALSALSTQALSRSLLEERLRWPFIIAQQATGYATEGVHACRDVCGCATVEPHDDSMRPGHGVGVTLVKQ